MRIAEDWWGLVRIDDDDDGDDDGDDDDDDGDEQVSIAKWHRLKLQQLNQQPKGQLQPQNLLRMPRSRMLQRNPVEVNNLNADLVGSFMIEKKTQFWTCWHQPPRSPTSK